MKRTRVVLVAATAIFGMSLAANAQLGLGGVVRGSGRAAGSTDANLGRHSGSVSGDLNSRTQIGGGLHNRGLTGDLNSDTQASANAERKKMKNASVNAAAQAQFFPFGRRGGALRCASTGSLQRGDVVRVRRLS